MQFQTPTLALLTAAAIRAAKARTELLLLLAGLAGIMTSIVYAPAMGVWQDLVNLMEHANGNENVEQEAALIFSEGASTLLFGHLATTAVASFLVIPFARASAPEGLVPSAGGVQAFWVRGLRSFLHMVAANGITMLIILFFIPIIAVLSSALGAIGSVLTLAGICLVIWTAIALTGTAHLAIAAEARDRRETLPSAFMRARLFIVPIAGSLALLLMAVMVIDVTFGALMVALAPPFMKDTVAMIFNGGLIYLTSALHVAALYSVPDFRDLRPT